MGIGTNGFKHILTFGRIPRPGLDEKAQAMGRMHVSGTRTWTYYEDIENNCGDFPNILKDYMKSKGPLR